jgi:hypothetical protein
VSQVQIERIAARIADPTTRARFVFLLTRANELVHEAARLRREAWADYRAATGEPKRSEKSVVGQYA